MKIALSTTRLIDFDGKEKPLDGIGQYTKMLAACIKDSGNNAQYYYFRNIKEFKRQQYGHHIFSTQPFNLYSCLLPRQMQLHKLIESQADLFHSTDYLIPRLKNTPVVATLHDAIMFKHLDMIGYRLRRLKNYCLKQSAQWADRIIAISHYIIPDLVKYYGVPEKKIHVIYNGLADEWFNRIDNTTCTNVLNKYNIKKNYVLCVGTLQPRKNIARLARAFLRLPQYIKTDYQLVIVGRAGWKYEETLRAIQQLRDNNAGNWLSYVTNDELKALYQQATAVALPSLSEGFGYPIAEAFASQTPVLAANCSSLPEVAGTAALFFDPYEEKSITTALEALLTNEKLRNEFTQKGIARAEKFKLKTFQQNILNMYNEF